MWAWLGQLIAGPLVSAYKAKLDAGNTTERLAADLAARELDVQKAEIEAQNQLRIAQIGRWYEPEKIMGYTVAAYLAKLVLWDTMFGLGTTGPLRGWAESTATLIVGAYFGKRTVENAIRIWKR